MQMLMRAVEDMFASPAFLAAQIRLKLEPSSSVDGREEQAASPPMDLKRIDQLYTALLKVGGPVIDTLHTRQAASTDTS